MNRDETDDGIDSVELPIDGTLDLHAFKPRDLKELLPHYLDTCRKKGILEVRIIHGKGIGTLRKSVYAILTKLSGITSIKTAGEDAGGWGATLVTLEPPDRETLLSVRCDV